MVKKITKTQAWFLATRPKTLFASLGPVILGLSVAYYHQGHFDKFIAALTLLCALLMQIGTNLVNDFFDSLKGVDNDKRLGPLRVTQQGLLNAQEVKWGFRICLSAAFLLGLFLMYRGGIPIIIIGLSSLLFAYIYTGGPYPLSYHGLGEITAFIFFGPIAVWGTYYLQTLNHHSLPVIFGMGPGFISATIMAINNLRDLHNDSQAKKRTLAVRLGENRARGVTLFFVLLSSFIPIWAYNEVSKPLLILGCFLPYLFFKNWLVIYRAPISQQLNQVLANTGKYLFFHCLLLSLALNIS